MPGVIARAAGIVALAAGIASAQPRATEPATAPRPLEDLELPLSGLRLQVPASTYRVDRAFVPELDGDADVITFRPTGEASPNDAFSMRVTVRALTCRAMRDTARGIIPTLREVPTGADRTLAKFERTYLVDAHHTLWCANRGSHAVMVELVDPGPGSWQELLAGVNGAMPATDLVLGDADGLLIPSRLFIAGSYARTPPETTIGGRLGFEAFAGADRGTSFASGLGGAFGLDGDLHATYELHFKAGVAHVFASRTALYVTARGGLQRSWPDGDAKFGWYAGGEADLHLPYLDVAGGVTTRGQFGRLALIRFHYDPTIPRAKQFGASAGVEWIHDGQVQMTSLYLAMAD